MIQDYEDLNIWQEGRKLVKDIYDVTADFPGEEKFGLVSQMRRAAVSIPSNIAEGFNRRSENEYRQFLYVSLGSCAELSTQLTLSFDLGYVGQELSVNLGERTRSLSKMIMSLAKKIGGSQ